MREVISGNEKAAERSFGAIRAEVAETKSNTEKTFAEMKSALQDLADTCNRRLIEQDSPRIREACKCVQRIGLMSLQPAISIM